MKYFILGVLFTLIGMPIIDFFTTWLANQSELHSYKIAKKIHNIQNSMASQENEQIVEQKEKIPMGFATSCIGFEVNNQEEEYEEE